MTRDVLISISGMQIAEDDSNSVEMITAGDYFLKNGNHYILYDEIQEDTGGVTRNTIKIRQSGLDIIKRGTSSVHMTFEKDKKNMSCYATPFGELMIGISTKDILIDEEEDRLKVRVAYSLDINYQHVSECNIVLDIHSKATADFRLLN
ncbi:DUF1934 domain-containing protein [Lacrimispora saccharolytica]|uniref:DUF1934 domain-containing protein n=1 Tax=Lacrimispora saccharolytica (strain ATCC 35040 / DSM 2544 / NRCC 2533 / WM1) TaxID=610130 RepID=D9R453_LACSW|nr:DUF1934 domain-containing protein [Lacrimispora saccharolytica]ADL03166.1 Domain of unknown function DUF1934 [[Clostridium] saccharolyticum WM1]QRV18657.1 DUF1934 domain-containing protein [Lacrimispora saccharolytica]